MNLEQEVISGRFQIEREVRTGGMGAIYRARDLTNGQPVALKVLLSQAIQDSERFSREAAILTELNHPGIVRYIAHGATLKGEHFLAMEWLNGEDLADRLDRGSLSLTEAYRLLKRGAEIMAYAHERGVIHRDIKPSNLFLPDGAIDRLKFLDFGIARVTKTSKEARQLTRTGAIMGTPGYMAPEQVQGAKDVDASADVFSLGCVLFECLTGVPAFEGEHVMAVMAKILLQEPPHLSRYLPSVPEALDHLLVDMLAKDPSARPRDAIALLHRVSMINIPADALVPEAPTLRTVKEASSPKPTFASSQAALTLAEQRVMCVILAAGAEVLSDENRLATPHASQVNAPSHSDTLRHAVEAHGGVLQPLAEGAILVVLRGVGGAPDQAARAARCALAIHTLFPELPLVVTMGRGQQATSAMAGEVIDNGVRLLRATRPGRIRLDAITAALLGRQFEVQEEGTLPFLIATREDREPTHVLLGKPSQFVGRARELSVLAGMFAGCVADQVTSATLVVGAPGVGKSRLKQEFVSSIKKHQHDIQVLWGTGDSLAQGAPFGILADVIRRVANIHNAEPIERKRHKLNAHMGMHLDEKMRAKTVAFLGEMANIPFPDDDNEVLRAARQDAALKGDAMRMAWEDWLLAECQHAPTLLILEDLQWGDLATVSFVDSALRNLRDHPFMVLALARPEVYHHFPALWKDRAVETIRLGPLPKKASEKLVADVLGDTVTPETMARVVEQADGNPFYLEELIRVVAAGQTTAFPDTVLGVVQARLDAEGSAAKRILRAASIYGARFSKLGVSALLGVSAHDEDVAGWLERLVDRELIMRTGSIGSVGDVDYVFHHALVRETAYAMLTAEDRLLGHLLAGNWLEQTNQGDAMTLAEHFNLGGANDRAAPWYLRAAEQALEASDLVAAITRAEKGIAAKVSPGLTGALLLVQAEAHVWRGELADAEARGLEAMADLPVATTPWFRAATQMSIAAAKQGRFDRVVEYVMEMATMAPEVSAASAQLSCLARVADYLTFAGRYAVADALIEKIHKRCSDVAQLDKQIAGQIYELYAIRASVAGNLAEALSCFESAQHAFEEAGDMRNHCAANSNLGFILMELGDFTHAEEVLRAAQSVAERLGLHDLLAVVLHNLGRAFGAQNRTEEARKLEEQAIHTFAQQGDRRLEGAARIYLAKIEYAAQNWARAENEAAQAVDVLELLPAHRCVALAMLARTLLAQNKHEAARVKAQEAYFILEAIGELEEGEGLVRLVYTESLLANHAFDVAHQVACQARDRLLLRAAKISDPTWRERYLTHVPENAALLELAASSSSAKAASA